MNWLTGCKPIHLVNPSIASPFCIFIQGHFILATMPSGELIFVE